MVPELSSLTTPKYQLANRRSPSTPATGGPRGPDPLTSLVFQTTAGWTRSDAA
jgi:hypothetical protein